ncbi:MAG: hypothetical protein ABI824_19235 [Acidobacteriota bacterium]
MPRTKKQATTATAPILAVPAAKPTRELTEIQEVLADYCGQMILRGGREKPIENLLIACLGYECREFGNEFQQDEIEKYIDTRIGKWRGQLEASWSAKPSSETGEAEPDRSTISKRIRADAREYLRDELLRFSREATPEEIHLMTTVMSDWSNNQSVPSDNLNRYEIGLGYAFEYTFGEGLDHYIRVPDTHWDLVKEYLKLLDGKRVGEK